MSQDLGEVMDSQKGGTRAGEADLAAAVASEGTWQEFRRCCS